MSPATYHAALRPHITRHFGDAIPQNVQAFLGDLTQMMDEISRHHKALGATLGCTSGASATAVRNNTEKVVPLTPVVKQPPTVEVAEPAPQVETDQPTSAEDVKYERKLSDLCDKGIITQHEHDVVLHRRRSSQASSGMVSTPGQNHSRSNSSVISLAAAATPRHGRSASTASLKAIQGSGAARVQWPPTPRKASTCSDLLNLPPPSEETNDENASAENSCGVVYTLKELQAGSQPGIDMTKRETYLSDEEFRKTFDMSIKEFNALSLWKKTTLKKSFGLF